MPFPQGSGVASSSSSPVYEVGDSNSVVRVVVVGRGVQSVKETGVIPSSPVVGGGGSRRRVEPAFGGSENMAAGSGWNEAAITAHSASESVYEQCVHPCFV